MHKFTLVLAATLLSVLAFGFVSVPANAAAANTSFALGQMQSKTSDLVTVHCRRWYHCHGWGCHVCGGGPGYHRPYYHPYGYHRPYRYRYRY